jgi:hypothetical protein
MRYPFRTVAVAIFAAPLLIAVPARASHDPSISDDESKCQIGTSLAIGKFVTSKAKCITKCEQGARKDPPLNPPGDCVTPFAGATLACVQKAEAKSVAMEQSKCAKDCPECYSGSDCVADSQTRIAGAEEQVDLLATLVFCDDPGPPGGDGLTSAEAKCQDTVAKTLSNFAKKKLNCYAKCRKDEHKGLTPPGTCLPATQEKAVACIAKEETKAEFLIDKKCDATVNPSADAPECYAVDGEGWVALVETAIDEGQPSLYCVDSPSAAFLD